MWAPVYRDHFKVIDTLASFCQKYIMQLIDQRETLFSHNILKDVCERIYLIDCSTKKKENSV